MSTIFTGNTHMYDSQIWTTNSGTTIVGSSIAPSNIISITKDTTIELPSGLIVSAKLLDKILTDLIKTNYPEELI